MLDLRKFILQHLLCLAGQLYALCQRATGRKRHLHGEIAFVERRDKLGAQPGKEQQGSGKQGKGGNNCHTNVMQAEVQAMFIYLVQAGKKAVGKSRLHQNRPFQEQGCHHRHISQRKDQGADDAEHQRFRHRRKIFPLDPRKRQDREKDDQDNEDGKSSAPYDTARTGFDLGIHFRPRQRPACQTAGVKMRQDAFDNHNRAVHNNTEVDRPQTHQVGGHSEQAHHNECKQHC